MLRRRRLRGDDSSRPVSADGACRAAPPRTGTTCTSATRTHTTVRDDPSSALLAISASRYGCIADELTALQLAPEHLHVLRDHVISEPDHQHLHSVRCCDHRENLRNPLRGRPVLVGDLIDAAVPPSS